MAIIIEKISDTKIWVHDGATTIMEFDTTSGAKIPKLDAVNLSLNPSSHPINLEGLILPANSNVIRGASINPTRASGWISFSGTVDATPAQVYTDYRELHTTGVAEVLGFGSFVFMDDGASCISLFGGQDIAEVDAGATILSAAGAPAVGVFARWMKLLLNGETFTPGGVAAVQFLSVQSNVTDVSAEDVSVFNVENASGITKSLLHLTNTENGFTNLLWLPDDGLPASLTNGTDLADISATANAGWIKVLVGSTVRYIPLYAVKASA
ncbi:MAG: hypothetical protein NUV80_07565 [Candidatus Berkelbacteria bacterium]|nr:hypothetical protein [Candidatus Berkelbacteria bacterium]